MSNTSNPYRLSKTKIFVSVAFCSSQ